MTSPRRELQGVGEQVPDDLLQPTGVAQDRLDRFDPGFELDFLGNGGRYEAIYAGSNQRTQVHRVRVELQLARDDFGDLEQIRDHLKLLPGIAFNGFQRPVYRVAFQRALPEHLRPAEDR